MAWRSVTDKQWELIKQYLPKRRRSRKGGRLPLDDRKCFEGILRILWTGAPWSELPERYMVDPKIKTDFRPLLRWILLLSSDSVKASVLSHFNC
jgi:transposase